MSAISTHGSRRGPFVDAILVLVEIHQEVSISAGHDALELRQTHIVRPDVMKPAHEGGERGSNRA